MSNEAVMAAFREIDPVLNEIIRLTKTCPIPKEQRAFLSMIITAKMMGAACASMEDSYESFKGQPLSAIAQNLFDRIIPMLDEHMRRAKH